MECAPLSIHFAEMSCGTPPDVNNTELQFHSTNYNSKAAYTCIEGYYHANGSLMKTCGREGMWEGEDMVCNKSKLLDSPI